MKIAYIEFLNDKLGRLYRGIINLSQVYGKFGSCISPVYSVPFSPSKFSKKTEVSSSQNVMPHLQECFL